MHRNRGLGDATSPTDSRIALDTFARDTAVPQGFPENPQEVNYTSLSPLIEDSTFPLQDTEAYSSGFISNTQKGKKSRPWFSKDQKNTERHKSTRALTGWKLGTAIAAGITSVILIGNISLLAAFSAHIRRKGYTSSIGPVQTGNCDAIKRLGTGVHIIINIISTLLLGASNYCMQTLSAPTRADVDRAHAKGCFLDIGIPSVRNLRFIKKKRIFFWLCLGLSSIPLHLVYNSIFFVSTVSNLYPIYFADESFETGASYNPSLISNNSRYDDPGAIQDLLMHSNKFERLSNDECINAYAKVMVEDRADLVLVIERPPNCTLFNSRRLAWELQVNGDCSDPSTTSLYHLEHYSDPFMPKGNDYSWFEWICATEGYPSDRGYAKVGDCAEGAWKEQLSPNQWTVAGTKVKYCLSEKVAPKCHLQVALNLIGVIIAFNFVKLVIMLMMTMSRFINQDPLVTIGDAAASYIEQPEPLTRGMCLLSAEDIVNSHESEVISAKEYKPQAKRWSAAVSVWRWVFLFCWTLVSSVVTISVLVLWISNLGAQGKGSFKSLWSLGIGALNPFTVIYWDIPSVGEIAVVGVVLVTNLPQLGLSLFYLIINGLVTAMAATAEWSNYAHSLHRPLRVSFPRSGQRSTYFLQLPYRYSVPLMAASILVHWLASQSLFMVQIYELTMWGISSDEKADPEAVTNATITTTAGYSPMGFLLTGVVVLLISAGTAGVGRFRLPEGMPLANNCSAAISAACHPIQGTSNRLPVRWGVVLPPEEREDRIGHCSFSNEAVGIVESGKLYA